MPVNDALTKKVFELDRASRADLVLKLLESLEIDDNDKNTDWVEEAQYRFEAWKKGEVRTLSEKEAKAEFKKRLEK